MRVDRSIYCIGVNQSMGNNGLSISPVVFSIFAHIYPVLFCNLRFTIGPGADLPAVARGFTRGDPAPRAGGRFPRPPRVFGAGRRGEIRARAVCNSADGQNVSARFSRDPPPFVHLIP